MYVFYGLLIWILSLAATALAFKMYPMFQTDVEQAQEDVRELISELADSNFTGFMTMGAISFVVVIAWPIVLVVLALALVIFCFAGVPYVMFRKMRAPEPESEADWVVPNNDVPRRNQKSNSRRK
jgi:hypothetical protein